MGDLDGVFKALADPTRREILAMLRARDLTAGALAERFPLALSTISGHFKVLREAGLVVTERQGTTIVYSLNTSVAEETLGAVLQVLQVGARRRERRHEGQLAR